MDTSQIELIRLSLTQLQLWVTGAAIFLGPLTGVLFTFWFQARKERRDLMMRLFLTLMAQRKTNPPTWELVNNLNTIDVVFAKYPKVIELWHQYYDLLCQQQPNWHLIEAKYLDLLSHMAQALGISSLSQTDIARFYSPMSHQNQFYMSSEIQQELLRVLKNSQSLQLTPRGEP